MANVDDLLRKQKNRLDRMAAESPPIARKKITRIGPTRPWQENLPQYQTKGDSPTLQGSSLSSTPNIGVTSKPEAAPQEASEALAPKLGATYKVAAPPEIEAAYDLEVTANSVVAHKPEAATTLEATPNTVATNGSEVAPKIVVTTKPEVTPKAAVHSLETRAAGEGASLKQTYTLGKGENFTQLPHAVSACLEREDFSSREFRVLSAVIRDTLGWGRAFAEFSAKDFEVRTNVSHAHIPAVIKSLEVRGVLIRENQAQRAKNRYSLNRTYFEKYITSKAGVTSTAEAATELGAGSATKVEGMGSHHVSGYQHPVEPLPAQNLSRVKKDLNKDLNNPLSQDFEDYLNTIKAPKKREGETYALRALKENFQDSEIHQCFEFLQTYGALKTGEPCHSPLTYLTHAMGEVLGEVKGRIEKETKQSESSRQLIELRQREDALAASEEAEWQAKEKAFSDTFPTENEQAQAIAEHTRGTIWKGNGPGTRHFAISAWFAQKG